MKRIAKIGLLVSVSMGCGLVMQAQAAPFKENKKLHTASFNDAVQEVELPAELADMVYNDLEPSRSLSAEAVYKGGRVPFFICAKPENLGVGAAFKSRRYGIAGPYYVLEKGSKTLKLVWPVVTDESIREMISEMMPKDKELADQVIYYQTESLKMLRENWDNFTCHVIPGGQVSSSTSAANIMNEGSIIFKPGKGEKGCWYYNDANGGESIAGEGCNRKHQGQGS